MKFLSLLLNFGIFLLNFSKIKCGNGRFFVTESCGSVVGPDFGAYLEFDKDSRQNNDGSFDLPQSVKGKLFECTIVVRGMPSTGEKRYMSIYWRNFHLREMNLSTIEHSPEKCGKAYVTVYSGRDLNAAEKHTLCGAGALPSHMEWEGEYATLFFHIDFTLSPTTTGAPSFYPEVYFRLDVTSFDYECKTTIENTVLLCNDSKRCLDDSLRCDYWFSRNCQSMRFPRDNTDTSRHPPANCFQQKVTTTTTTTPAPPLPPPDYTALYVIVSIVATLGLLFWCCWRPGYIIWRSGRLRNAPCFHSLGKCIPCCVHSSPFCAFLGEYPCCRCCALGYGSSPTGGSAWIESKRMEAMLRDQQESACASDTSETAEGEKKEAKKKTMKERLLPCVGGKTQDSKSTTAILTRRTNSVKPLERESKDDKKKDDKKAVEKPAKNAYLSDARNNGSDVNDKMSSETGNRWLLMVTADGGHLREHR